jgi:hypothetical protein
MFNTTAWPPKSLFPTTSDSFARMTEIFRISYVQYLDITAQARHNNSSTPRVLQVKKMQMIPRLRELKTQIQQVLESA